MRRRRQNELPTQKVPTKKHRPNSKPHERISTGKKRGVKQPKPTPGVPGVAKKPPPSYSSSEDSANNKNGLKNMNLKFDKQSGKPKSSNKVPATNTSGKSASINSKLKKGKKKKGRKTEKRRSSESSIA